jgi:hypothetical protein
MNTSSQALVSRDTMNQWLDEKLDEQKIEARLRSQGFDEEAVAVSLREYKKLRRSRQQTTGFIVAGFGAVLGFLSCLITLINPIPELYNWFLYGFTSVAILVVFSGLYLVFE